MDSPSVLLSISFKIDFIKSSSALLPVEMVSGDFLDSMGELGTELYSPISGSAAPSFIVE